MKRILVIKKPILEMTKDRWISWLKGLRATEIVPLGEAIATGLGLANEHVHTFRKLENLSREASKFRLWNERALLECGAKNRFSPVEVPSVKLPVGESYFVQARAIYKWLQESGFQIPDELREWLTSSELVYERLDGSAGKKVAPISSFRSLSQAEERSLDTSWRVLASLALVHFDRDLGQNEWGFVNAIYATNPPKAISDLQGRLVDRKAAKNHISSAIVNLLGETECKARFPVLYKHWVEFGIKPKKK